MSRCLILILLVAGVGLALRQPKLDERPFHTDEGVNGIKCVQAWQNGTYKYDPNEHHGPALFYATRALGDLTGLSDFRQLTDTRLRWVTVLFGIGLILLLPLLADGLGSRGTVWAGLFTAVSPALVFYSRYYIHETLLAFFALLALAGGWRYWRTRKLFWALVAGAGVGFMHATKETFVLSLGAAGFALALNCAWSRWVDASNPPATPRPIRVRHVMAAAGVWALVWVLLFTSFFTNAAGLLDSFKAFSPWLGRAEGQSPHIHPWPFYLHRLLCFKAGNGPVWSEALILVLGILGAWTGFARRGLGDASATFVRFLATYTFALMAGYSIIAYKTPWCLVGFWHGMILLAGVGAGALVRRARKTCVWLAAAVATVLVCGAGHLGWQAWRAAVPYAADWRNPYVYAQTSANLIELVQRVESLADVSPQTNQMLIKVMAPENDYWPLPWYLRRFPRVGWWDRVPSAPDTPYAPVMIVSDQFHAPLDEKGTHLMVGLYQLRPRVFLELYVELDLWRAWLAKHPPEPRPD